VSILIIILLILCNGFFALAEIAFVSSRREIIESLGSKNSRVVLAMMEEPDRFLSSIQVGITLIGIVSGTFSGVAFAGDLATLLSHLAVPIPYTYQVSLISVIALVTYFSIVFGELVPKVIGLRNPEKTILIIIPIISFFAAAMHPIVVFLSFSTKTILRLIGIQHTGIDEKVDPVKEILGIAKVAAIKNKINRQQETIIRNTMSIKTLSVADIMVRREEMRTLRAGMNPADALLAAHVHHHTRYPLVDEEQGGAIIGYVNFKDIVNALRLNPQSQQLAGICRPIANLRDSDLVVDALPLLIRTHQHIALVRNRNGALTGLVTLENMLETIVGDIKDEYDILPDYLYNINETRMVAGGGVTLKQLRRAFGEEFPETDETLSRWLSARIPPPLKVEKKVTVGSLEFEVRKISRAKIHEVLIDRREAGR
jgi:putative hemolysin